MRGPRRTERARETIKRTKVGAEVRDVVRRPEDQAAAAYRQAEAVAGLYHLLDPGQPLPPLRRDWVISPDLALHIVHTVLRDQARSVVEFGSGASTVLLALALRRAGGGHLTSFDHSPTWIAETEAQLRAYGVEDLVTLRLAPLRPTPGSPEVIWYRIDTRPEQVDLALIDGPPWETCHRARHPSMRFLAPLLAPGAKVFLDDADREDEREVVARWSVEHPGIIVRWLDCEKGAAEITWPGPLARRTGAHG